MIAEIRTLWRRNRWLVVAFGLVLALTLAFAVRAAMFAFWWDGAAGRDQPIEGWMTPRYVAMSWHVPREVMESVEGLPTGPRDGKPPSLREIAEDQNIPLEELIARIEAAIAAHRANPGKSGPGR